MNFVPSAWLHSFVLGHDGFRRPSQLFSGPGKKGNPFWGLDHFSGAATKQSWNKGATEQLSKGDARELEVDELKIRRDH